MRRDARRKRESTRTGRYVNWASRAQPIFCEGTQAMSVWQKLAKMCEKQNMTWFRWRTCEMKCYRVNGRKQNSERCHLNEEIWEKMWGGERKSVCAEWVSRCLGWRKAQAGGGSLYWSDALLILLLVYARTVRTRKCPSSRPMRRSKQLRQIMYSIKRTRRCAAHSICDPRWRACSRPTCTCYWYPFAGRRATCAISICPHYLFAATSPSLSSPNLWQAKPPDLDPARATANQGSRWLHVRAVCYLECRIRVECHLNGAKSITTRGNAGLENLVNLGEILRCSQERYH